MSTFRQTRLPDSRQQEYLDTGSSASAWLHERTDASTSRVTLEWDFSQLDTTDVNLGWSSTSERLHTGDSEVDSTHTGGTQLQNLYSSVRFLDNNYKADFVPNECLIDPLLEASREARTHPGNALSLCRFPSTRPDRPSTSYLLAFTSGTRRNKLTAICLDSHDSKRNTAHQAHKIVAVSPTPIEQISSVPEKDGILVGLRNASSVILYRIGIRPQEDDGDTKLSCRVLAQFSEQSFANACPLDFCLQHFNDSTPDSSKALIIDDSGSIWQTASGRDLKKAAARSKDHLLPGLDKLRHGGHPNHTLKFARIAYGLEEHQAVAVLSHCVRFFSLQDPSGDRTLLEHDEGKPRILDMATVPAGAQECPFRSIVTEKEVLWLDIRKSANPVLRYKHRRERGIDLRLSSVYDAGILRIMLWSPSDCVMTLFSTTSTPVQLLHPPYDLHEQAYLYPRMALAMLPPDRPSRRKKPKHRAIQVAVQLANGSVIHRKLETKSGGSEAYMDAVVESVPVQSSGLDAKAATIQDLSRMYRSAFFPGSSLSEASSLPTSLKLDEDVNLEGQAHIPLSTVLSTSCDDYGSEHTAIAKFTGRSALDRAAIALETLQQDMHSLQQLEEAPFSFLIGDMLSQLEASDNPLSLAKKVRSRYGLKSGIYTVKRRDIQESHLYACEQVAMDLALSKTVFASTLPSRPQNDIAADVDVSTYKAESELPPVEYGYFKPTPRPGLPNYSAGAQALLCEWTLGADPSSRPAYINPYDKSVEDTAVDGQLDAYRLRIAEGTDISASQPLPGPSRLAVPARKAKVVEKAQDEQVKRFETQLAVPASTQSQTQQASQAIPMPFSQVVPGVHGGRPIKKKRVGGF